MKVTSLQLHNFRSFGYLPFIDLGAINVFIGANNAGKSSILRSLYAMQSGSDIGAGDIRAGSATAKIEIGLTDTSTTKVWPTTASALLRTELSKSSPQSVGFSYNLADASGANYSVGVLPAIDPDHFEFHIYRRERPQPIMRTFVANMRCRLFRACNFLQQNCHEYRTRHFLDIKNIAIRVLPYWDLWSLLCLPKVDNVQAFICQIVSLYLLIKWVKEFPIS